MRSVINPFIPNQCANLAKWVTLVLTLILCQTPTALAQSGTYKQRAADGSVIFSDAPIKNGRVVRTSYKSETRVPVAANPCKGLSSAQLDAKGEALNTQFVSASRQTGVDADLLKAVARAESCFDPEAVSRVGAQGLMQLMPATAIEMGVSNSFDLEQNLDGGASYLAAMLKRYNNNLDLTLAAYNAGPGNVDRYNGVPPFDETQKYIVSVRNFLKRYKAQHQVQNQTQTKSRVQAQTQAKTQAQTKKDDMVSFIE